MNLEALTLVEAAGKIRDGALSPVDYIQALFARVEAIEPRVQAWICVT